MNFPDLKLGLASEKAIPRYNYDEELDVASIVRVYDELNSNERKSFVIRNAVAFELKNSKIAFLRNNNIATIPYS